MGISIGVNEEGEKMNFRDILGVSNLRHLRLIELLYACRTGLSSDQLLEELECSLSVLLKDVKLINSQQDANSRQSFKLSKSCCMKSAKILLIYRKSFT